MTKKRAKGGGRKLKAGVQRSNQTGRIVKAAQETRVMSDIASARMEQKLALEAGTWKRRQVDPSLSVTQATMPEHGSVLDKWLAVSDRFRRNGEPHRALITKAQYDALRTFHEVHERYKMVIAARRSRSASDFSAAGGHDGRDPFDPDHEDRDFAAEKRFTQARRRILENVSLGMMAIEAVVFENKDCRNMAGDLREAANALVRLWRVQDAA